MSRIGDSNTGGAGFQNVSSPRSDAIRRAITANMNGQSVDTDVAPMMPDLLTRPDVLTGPAKPTNLGMPSPPDSVSPPGPSEKHAAIRSAGSKIQGAISQIGDGQGRQALQECLQVVQHYGQLKEEVLMRSEFA